MLLNYANVLVGLLAVGGGAFALTYEILVWHADAATDRALDDLTRPRRHARKADLWNSPTVPLSQVSWTSSPSSATSSTAT